MLAAAVWAQLGGAAGSSEAPLEAWDVCDGNVVNVFPDCPGKGCYGTAWERSGWAERKAQQLDLNLPWNEVRDGLIDACGLTLAPSTRLCFDDEAHLDCCAMLVGDFENLNHQPHPIHELGSHILKSSGSEGEGGSWCTCQNGSPQDVCHQTFGARTAFKLIWCEGSRLAAIIDDRGGLLNFGEPGSGKLRLGGGARAKEAASRAASLTASPNATTDAKRLGTEESAMEGSATEGSATEESTEVSSPDRESREASWRLFTSGRDEAWIEKRRGVCAHAARMQAGELTPAQQEAAMEYVGPGGASGWWDEWQVSIERWWLMSPIANQNSFSLCVTAFGLFLATRLDSAFRNAFGIPIGAAAPPPAPRLDAECEHQGQFESLAEEHKLPEFPEFPPEFRLPPVIPIPRLLPDWERLQAQRQQQRLRGGGSLGGGSLQQQSGQQQSRASPGGGALRRRVRSRRALTLRSEGSPVPSRDSHSGWAPLLYLLGGQALAWRSGLGGQSKETRSEAAHQTRAAPQYSRS